MGVMQILVRSECPGIDFLAYRFIGVSERDACKHPAIDFLHCEHLVVKRGIQYVPVDPDIAEHISGHFQTIVHQIEGGEQYVFEKLEVTVVAVRHIAANQGDFIFAGYDSVAVAPYDLPYVRILFMRHDAGACSKLVGKGDEAVVGAHIHRTV